MYLVIINYAIKSVFKLFIIKGGDIATNLRCIRRNSYYNSCCSNTL